MRAQVTRRELTWLVGIVVWVAAYLWLRHLGVSVWYSGGIGAILGGMTVVVIAALINESK